MRCRTVRGWKELCLQKFDHWLSLWCAHKSGVRNQTQSCARGGTNKERMLSKRVKLKKDVGMWSESIQHMAKKNAADLQAWYTFSPEYPSQWQIKPLKNCKHGSPLRAERSLIVGLVSQQHMSPQREFSCFLAEQIEPINLAVSAVGWPFNITRLTHILLSVFWLWNALHFDIVGEQWNPFQGTSKDVSCLLHFIILSEII